MNFIKSFIVIFLSFIFISAVAAEDINTSIISVDSSNSNLIKIFLDKNISSNSLDVNSDIKVFKDLKSTNIVKDLVNNKIIKINLSNELEKNSSYTLLSVYGVKGTIDFKISDLINGLEITGDGTTGIEKINILDKKTLEVTFTEDIIGEDIDVKILKEYNLKGLKINSDNTKILEGNLLNKLDPSSNYLIMLFSFSTNEGDNYVIDNSIYDFTTSGKLNESEIIKEEVIADEVKTGNIALNSAETPDTGSETWILLLFTFILSNVIYFRKKIVK